MAKLKRWQKRPDPILWYCDICQKIAPFKDGNTFRCYEHWLESPHGQERMLAKLNEVNGDE